MVAALKYLRSPALRPALAALLMLHVGIFQSGAGHAGMASVGGGTAHVVAHSAMAAPTCHIAAGGIHFRHVPCCTAGECQCAAGCYQGDALAKVVAGPFARGIEPSFSDPATPPPQLARQLRPPIAL